MLIYMVVNIYIYICGNKIIHEQKIPFLQLRKKKKEEEEDSAEQEL